MYSLRQARADEIPLLQEIEQRASERYVGLIDQEVVESCVPAPDLRAAQADGRLFVAADEVNRAVGFALVVLVGGLPHLEELDVLPEHGNRGLGTRLVEAVSGWARDRGHPSLSLSTYRDVAFNAPFYERRGFRALHPDEWTPGLATVFERERQKGWDMARRVIMVRPLPLPLPLEEDA